ncbi:HypC/HybG/HupF family hydrogenase formation chaperone [Halodesulfovibrio sp. MK-HDV]|jgi:hydrogenase expression/formation protein HypC|uniref:HypC/HybG/HupF family hydrogenase formation chaperone n=1 Tax=unclassified Halodesulfovibrio TaxID=2644657 RepID=UPI001369F26B|nr:HypC/HybG/HupF family hydrogenase formation chaperone [Halodesulfovibrio sp. MK-HDV]KAF1077680.1 Hydrogenase maturation factor HybG [Halodesulfovibrio sp. MK-HDV]
MCLAIPAEVVEIQSDTMAKCRVGQSETYIETSTMLLESPAEIGDFVIVHAGFALRKLDFDEAQETLRLLRQMAGINENTPGAF